ncbi:MAG: hypothetical protein H8Z69_05595 [Nanohaloarchaea archaeon]|nr:hypothetical protein [Candidatus Nanohaloarchaea archaeon]
MSEKIFLVLILLLSAAAVTAPASEPRHPLSQVYPVDADLNMSHQDIFNVTELDLYSGLVFSGNKIQTAGNANLILWNNVKNRIDLSQNVNTEGNNINLSGGSLTSQKEICVGNQC